MVGLILDGKSITGSYQVGAYYALKKCHVRFKATLGRGIGAFNAAMLTVKKDKLLKEIWTDATLKDILDLEDEMVIKFFKENNLLDEENIKNISTKKLEEGMKISNFSAFVRNNIKEDEINSSKIKYSMISLKKNKIEPIKLYSDNIKKGDLADYIVSSAYMPLLIGYDKSNPWLVPMLEKIDCEKIYYVNADNVEYNFDKYDAEVIEIKPSLSFGHAFFDKENPLINMRRGYLDTLKAFEKYDGDSYYFEKKKDSFYQKVIKHVDEELLNVAGVILKSNSTKETVIKALEYMLNSTNQNNMNIYNPIDVIRYGKTLKTRGIIFDFIRSLNK